MKNLPEFCKRLITLQFDRFLDIVTGVWIFPVSPEIATSRAYRAARELSGIPPFTVVSPIGQPPE